MQATRSKWRRYSGALLATLVLATMAFSDGMAHARDQTPGEQATVKHVPPAEAEDGKSLRLVAIIDDAWTEEELATFFRPIGSPGAFVKTPFERSSAGAYYATIPAEEVHRPGIEYYIAGTRRDGAEIEHFASIEWPHEVRVEPETSSRWIEVEERRLGGRRERVALRLESQGFERGVQPDWYARGEVEWTHRLVTVLYSFSLGYGFLEGKTPADELGEVPSEERSIRYGYGGIRFRLASFLWLDGRVILGFGRGLDENAQPRGKGIVTGASGQLTLGKEWRSGVVLGIEHLQEVGSAKWLRLQWDTAPPFLMGATVKVTGQAGSRFDDGFVFSYDIAYPMPSSGVALTAYLSYGALRIVDISNPLAPTQLGVCGTPGLDWGHVYVDGAYAYVANYDNG
ncbi:MAG: hypothetical protein V2A73_22105, partial [Pseudomonadota bacterium]